MKRKQMQLADSRLVLSSGAKLAHCHGQPVGRLILRPRCKLWITCAMLDALIERAYSVSDGAARLPGCPAARCRSFIAVSIVSAVRRTSSVSF